jgi:hypothetical protein
MRIAQLQFFGELNDLLPPGKRNTPFHEQIDDHASLKHVIESLGIPHTEIGAVELDGRPADLAARVPDQSQVDIYPFHYPRDHLSHPIQPLTPVGEARFILDIHLGKLAVYLRILGFDSLYQNDSEDAVLAQLAEKLQRILLSKDRRLLMRKQVLYGYCVRSQDPARQALEIIQRYHLSDKIKPLQRCLDCNAPLEPVEKTFILERLEPLTRQYYHDFHICPNCNKIYWKGSHYDRMRQFISWIRSQPFGST